MQGRGVTPGARGCAGAVSKEAPTPGRPEARGPDPRQTLQTSAVMALGELGPYALGILALVGCLRRGNLYSDFLGVRPCPHASRSSGSYWNGGLF